LPYPRLITFAGQEKPAQGEAGEGRVKRGRAKLPSLMLLGISSILVDANLAMSMLFGDRSSTH